jgi:opacity protein-like surface antigen
VKLSFSQLIMKKFLALASIVAVTATALPAQAQFSQTQNQKNYIGPAVTFGGGSTVFGATSRFGIADNISVRPFLAFGSGATVFGGSATYDFNINGGFTPYGGAGLYSSSSLFSNSGLYFEIGADYNASDTFVLNANHRFNSGGITSIGAGFKF